MKYEYVLAHTMGPFLREDGIMTESSKDAMKFEVKELAEKYLKDSGNASFLYVQTLCVEEV